MSDDIEPNPYTFSMKGVTVPAWMLRDCEEDIRTVITDRVREAVKAATDITIPAETSTTATTET
jgi:hypothetical protein